MVSGIFIARDTLINAKKINLAHFPGRRNSLGWLALPEKVSSDLSSARTVLPLTSSGLWLVMSACGMKQTGYQLAKPTNPHRAVKPAYIEIRGKYQWACSSCCSIILWHSF
jgi:hypothetical protein